MDIPPTQIIHYDEITNSIRYNCSDRLYIPPIKDVLPTYYWQESGKTYNFLPKALKMNPKGIDYKPTTEELHNIINKTKHFFQSNIVAIKTKHGARDTNTINIYYTAHYHLIPDIIPSTDEIHQKYPTIQEFDTKHRKRDNVPLH
jgi:hypothetical protein